MYVSYHSLPAEPAMFLRELNAKRRYAKIVEVYRCDQGDLLVEPDGSYLYKILGYATEQLHRGVFRLVLVVCHADLDIPESAVASAVFS